MLHPGGQQHARQLVSGFARRDHVVDDCDMSKVYRAAYLESIPQVSLTLRCRQSGLVGRVRDTMNVPHLRQPAGLEQGPAHLGDLVESAMSMSAPVQRYRKQCVDVLGKPGRSLAQKLAERRSVVETPPELVEFDCRIDREAVLERRYRRRDRTGFQLASRTDRSCRSGTTRAGFVDARQLGKAGLADRMAARVDAAEYTTNRHYPRVEPGDRSTRAVPRPEQNSPHLHHDSLAAYRNAGRQRFQRLCGETVITCFRLMKSFPP